MIRGWLPQRAGLPITVGSGDTFLVKYTNSTESLELSYHRLCAYCIQNTEFCKTVIATKHAMCRKQLRKN